MLSGIPRVVGAIIGESSLPQREAARVEEQQDALEMDVIKEMLLGSPHPAVNSIAAQALSSLCLDEPFGLNAAVNDALYVRIDQVFTQSFVRTGITAGKEFELLQPISTIERLARALIYNPFRISRETLDRLAAFASMDPGNIRLAVLQAVQLWYCPSGCREGRNVVTTRATLIRGLLDSKDIEINRLHPWQRRQLSHAAAISSLMQCYSSGEWDGFLRDLLENLNLDKPPLLQQELLISLISPETILEQNMVQSSERFPRTGSVRSPYSGARI
jgi:hypothetical protein